MATTAQLNENSHQGFEAAKRMLCLAAMQAKSNTASGMPLCLRRNGIGSRSSGKERDAETGLDYFLARYYSGAQGRFISPDWSGIPEPVPYANFDNPQSLNLYAYVNNNPLSFADLDGHKLDCTGKNAEGAGCKSIAEWNAEHGIDPDKKASSAKAKGKSVTYNYADGSTVVLIGNHPSRDNNPGNQVAGEGRIGKDKGFVIFDSATSGWDALADDLQSHSDDDVLTTITVRTPPDNGKDKMLKGNDPVAYAKRVAARIGVNPSTKISDLTPAQFNNMVVAIAREEGYFAPGGTRTYSAPPKSQK